MIHQSQDGLLQDKGQGFLHGFSGYNGVLSFKIKGKGFHGFSGYNRVDVAHTPPTMVFFLLFLFMPLFTTFLLTIYVMLCKPGCAVSAADTSLV